ncbi:VOC family protein [Cytobacillus purgationiresistens]|uniref:Catechol 2,3-dioxygenase-like lactoylglutathione lyase family enzyme n=1 Tax=Cytobacillus purgationiresistens TaxID=863449 RepID=A0ABU0AIC4_9BACI|nr:VOC family protein [Cytobacillus purgationiresistens]MDQ0269825.1 catechol 2,3-dioxygenase-like lactoylglutathione lyase family enzyme [Cytobacillus purgationiresistens]
MSEQVKELKPLLGNNEVNQIAFVVKDIEIASADFAKLLGIPNPGWFLTGEQEVSQVVFKGEPTASRSKLVFLNTSTVQVELIEPNEDPGTMREFVDTEGEGIHHIAFEVDLIKDRLPALEEKGYPLLQSGKFTSSEGRYVYADTFNDFKTLVELLESADPRDTKPSDESGKPLLGTNKIEQLALVVKDLDATADAYCTLLGVEKPAVIQSGGSEITQVVYNGKPTEADSRYMFIKTPLLEIELIEPGNAPSTWKTHLETNGEGVHHISFVVKGMDEKIKVLEDMGYPVIQRGNFYNGNGRYAYMDTTSTFKVIIELLEKYNQ